MADISARITRKSLAAKRKAAIKTIKAQAKEKIREVKMEYNSNPERLKAKEAEREQKKALRLQKANARLAYNARQPRQYTLGEDIFNSVSHGIGAGLSVAAIVLLIIKAALHTPAEFNKSVIVTGVTLFGSSMFVLYLFSTLYHAITALTARRVFSVFNHNAIYLLLAGTATPYILTLVPAEARLLTFILVWSITIVFIALYSVFGARLRSFSVFTYIVIGLALTIAFGLSSLSAPLNTFSRVMLLLGCAVYLVGGIFFFMRKYKWTHCIFHMFVIAGSILHFFSVYYIF